MKRKVKGKAPPFRIRRLKRTDRGWISALLEQRWGSPAIVTRGNIQHADKLPGFVAMDGNRPVGLITYKIEGGECEIVTLDSLVERKGIGSALVVTVYVIAGLKSCRRLWLVTTNDNTPALRFYQKRGFGICAFYRNAVRRSRRLKPQIATFGVDGIPIRDEIELELPIKSIIF